MRPICVPCRVSMVPEKNGFLVRDPAVNGFPSTFWSGDKYKCPLCAHEIVSGFGKEMQDHILPQGMKDTAMEFGHNPPRKFA